MDLASVTNAPRELTLGGVTYRARALTLGQLGEVLAWLQDRQPDEPALLTSEASRLALATNEGLSLLIHLACEHHHSMMTREESFRIATTLDKEAEQKLLSIAFRRRPGKPPEPGDPPCKDLAEANWGELFACVTRHQCEAYPGASALSLDQLDNILNRGESWTPDALSPSEVQRMWEEAQSANPSDKEPPND